jgi:hypothetical protein
MSSPLEKFGISLDDIMADADVRAAKLEVAEQAADFWRGVDQGNYKPDVQVVENGDEILVGDQRDIANLMEYGSVHNEEYAARAKTEAQFNSGGGDDLLGHRQSGYDGGDGL